MSKQLLYLDSSAVVKLVMSEPESPGLFEFLTGWRELVTSELTKAEVMRAASRAGNPAHTDRAVKVLQSIHLLHLRPGILQAATKIEPNRLGTLPAIHLASALSVREDLAAFVAYDQALLEAAREAGLEVHSPSP